MLPEFSPLIDDLTLSYRWRATPGEAAGLVILMHGIGYYMLHNTLQTNATQLAPEVRGTAVSLFAALQRRHRVQAAN